HVLINGHEYILNNVVPDPTTTVTVQANQNSVTITVASVALLANGDTVEIAGNQYTVSNINGPPANTFDIAPPVPAGATWTVGTEVRRLPRTFDITPAVPAGATWAVGTAVQRLRRANNPGVPAPTINLWGAASLYPGAIVELDNGQRKETST